MRSNEASKTEAMLQSVTTYRESTGGPQSIASVVSTHTIPTPRSVTPFHNIASPAVSEAHVGLFQPSDAQDPSVNNITASMSNISTHSMLNAPNQHDSIHVTPSTTLGGVTIGSNLQNFDPAFAQNKQGQNVCLTMRPNSMFHGNANTQATNFEHNGDVSSFSTPKQMQPTTALPCQDHTASMLVSPFENQTYHPVPTIPNHSGFMQSLNAEQIHPQNGLTEPPLPELSHLDVASILADDSSPQNVEASQNVTVPQNTHLTNVQPESHSQVLSQDYSGFDFMDLVFDVNPK